MTQPAGYSRLHIILHWLVVVLIIPQFLLNDSMGEALDAAMEGTTAPSTVLVPLHVFTGITILVLVIWRLALRAKNGVPPLPEEEAPALKLVANLTHWGLYAVLALIVVSGGLAWFGGVETAGDIHGALTTVLLILVGLHVLGALYQQFVLKTNILDRMRTPQL